MGSSGLLRMASAVSHSTMDLKFVRVKKADASSGSLLPPAPVVAAMVLFDELPLSRGCRCFVAPLRGAAFLHKGQPLFEKLMCVSLFPQGGVDAHAARRGRGLQRRVFLRIA